MYIKPILLALAAALLLFIIVGATKRASHDRDWKPYLSKLPIVESTNTHFSIAPYLMWTYEGEAPKTMEWGATGPHAYDDVAQVWFVVEPAPDVPGMAHTLVLFEFNDGALIGLTVEARKEVTENYSPFWGLFNKFELIYQWASPKDLLTRRAIMLERELYIYPLELSESERRAYLRTLLARTKSIERRARFYNTASSNCTNELAKSGALGWHPAFVFTGFSARALHSRGRIAGEGDFDAVKARAKMDETVIALNELDEDAFNAALLEALK